MRRDGRGTVMTGAWRAGIVALGLIALAAGARADDPRVLERMTLAIETASGELHAFDVEVARTVTERARGLMFRESMPPDAGMLFVYPGEQQIRMWMKNTLIPLDMVFVDSEGRILEIAENTEPLSETVIASSGPARAVIELNGGTARRLGIRSGDRVRHPLFGGD